MSWRQRKSTVKDKEARGHINLSIEMFNLNKKKKRVFSFHFEVRGWGKERERLECPRIKAWSSYVFETTNTQKQNNVFDYNFLGKQCFSQWPVL
jgi:hypothetical protein